MNNLDLEPKQTKHDPSEETKEPNDTTAATSTPDNEETKSTASKKKRNKKGKGNAAANDGPSTRTRGRLAAFLAQQKQN